MLTFSAKKTNQSYAGKPKKKSINLKTNCTDSAVLSDFVYYKLFKSQFGFGTSKLLQTHAS